MKQESAYFSQRIYKIYCSDRYLKEQSDSRYKIKDLW